MGREADSSAALRNDKIKLCGCGKFAGLMDELDGGLVDEDALQGGEAEFEGLAVEPLDDAFHALAVVEHDDHGRLRLHLFLEIKDLGVAGFGLGCTIVEMGRCFADELARALAVAVGARDLTGYIAHGQAWADEFAIAVQGSIRRLMRSSLCCFTHVRISTQREI